MNHIEQAPLGKKSTYINTYLPSLLFPIPRKFKRDEIGVSSPLPFKGVDIWNGFEISWLNPKGKPVVAIAEFRIPCESPHLIESKSFKLYLNSFNNSKFESFNNVKELLITDLSKSAGAKVEVQLYSLQEAPQKMGALRGFCLDDLDIECTHYLPELSYLSVNNIRVEEVVHTHLLKSNCLVTGQPDWGSIEIAYHGSQIDHEGLLRYIVSLRDHNEFHEQCVERIFCDIQRICKPEVLSVYARYTRRGGLDINPVRTSLHHSLHDIAAISNERLIRQ